MRFCYSELHEIVRINLKKCLQEFRFEIVGRAKQKDISLNKIMCENKKIQKYSRYQKARVHNSLQTKLYIQAYCRCNTFDIK